jgi:amino acid adenylation domain-containing protein
MGQAVTSVREMQTPILARFIDHSTHYGNSPALFVDGQSHTYRELGGLGAAIGTVLQRHGVRRGDRIGLFAEGTIQTYASILGIFSCAACYVPLKADNPVARNRDILADAGIRVLLYADCEEAVRALASSPDTQCEAIHTREIAAHEGPLQSVSHRPDDLCYLLFTSGSTGKPKGVPIYCSSLWAFLDTILESGRYDFTRHDRFLQMFELTFDLSVFSFLIPLSVGASFYPLPRKGIACLEVVDILETQEISVALMVPSVINYLKPYFGELSLPRIRYSLFCGEALHHDTLSAWSACVPSAKIENLYGPTEATIFCLRYEWQRGELPHPHGKGIVPIGTPMRGVEAFIRTEDGGPGPGELCLIGEQVTSSYWNDASKTEEAFGTNEAGKRFYRTGDLCTRDQAGNFLYLGRIDNQVKIDGHRIELEEIEFQTRAFGDARQAAAVVNTSEAGQFIVLFLEGDGVEAPVLFEHLRSHLPAYMMPREIVTVSRFPLNSNGKIDRNALMRRHMQRTRRLTPWFGGKSEATKIE